MRTRALAAVILIVQTSLLGCVGKASSPPSPESRPTPRPLYASVRPTTITDLINTLAEGAVSAGAPGVVFRWTRDGVEGEAHAGLAQIDPSVPVNGAQAFRIGSITKIYVAALAMLLQESGQLDLDTKLDRYDVSTVPGAAKITLRMLLNHTSGLFDYAELPAVYDIYRTDPNHVWTPEQLIALAAEQAPYFEPGTDWHYSNTNYMLLGRVLERVSKKSLGTLLDERVFAPLDLGATTFPSGRELPTDSLHGYLISPSNQLVDVSDTDPSEAWAAGAIIATAPDVQRFLTSLITDQVVTAASLAQMKEAVDVQRDSLIQGYGLGLYRVRTCGVVWGHDGEIFGYESFAYVSDDATRSVVLATNWAGDARWLRPILDAVFC